MKNFPVTIKDPDEEIITSWSHPYYTYIKNFVGGVETSLRNGDFATAFEKIDIATYVDYWLIHELTTNEEPQHPKSCYMFKDKMGKMKAGPVWDFDCATFIPNKGRYSTRNSIYYGRLFEDPVFVQRVKERWNTLKAKFDTVSDYIEMEKNRLLKSADINIGMWPISIRINEDETLPFNDAVERMKAAYNAKLQWLDIQINNM